VACAKRLLALCPYMSWLSLGKWDQSHRGQSSGSWSFDRCLSPQAPLASPWQILCKR